MHTSFSKKNNITYYQRYVLVSVKTYNYQNAHVSVIAVEQEVDHVLFWTHGNTSAGYNNAIDVVYNYGAFDFNTPNFVI
jgi:hypothetical protein